MDIYEQQHFIIGDLQFKKNRHQLWPKTTKMKNSIKKYLQIIYHFRFGKKKNLLAEP
jgi:hypothetical protein